MRARWKIITQATTAGFALTFGAWFLSGATNDPPFQPHLPDSSLWPQGRYVYQRNRLACHGTDGSGRDAAAKDLNDVWDQPVAPTDLRQPMLCSGQNLDVVFRVLLTGVKGTPMPSFPSLSEDQIWQLAAFIGQLRRGQETEKNSPSRL